MHPALQAALIVASWVLVILLLAGGWWFLRKHQLLHAALGILAALTGIFLLIRLRELFIMLLLASVLAFILDGLVERLGRRLPRPAAVAVVYLGMAVLLAIAGTLFIPRIVHQAQLFVQATPGYAEQARAFAGRITSWYGAAPEQVQNAIHAAIEQLQTYVKGATGEVEHALLETLAWTVKGVLILVMSVYLLLDKDGLREQFVRLFPVEFREEAQATMAEIALTFSSYLRGQATVILFVAGAVTGMLLITGIPYAFLIGFVAGVLEVIPYFGAISGAIPAVILGFMKSPVLGVILIGFFILLNQAEGHLVIPLVMGHHLELRPLTILVALIAGEMLYGIPGMIIAVPVVSLVRVVIPHGVKHYRLFRMRERTDGREMIPR